MQASLSIKRLFDRIYQFKNASFARALATRKAQHLHHHFIDNSVFILFPHFLNSFLMFPSGLREMPLTIKMGKVGCERELLPDEN